MWATWSAWCWELNSGLCGCWVSTVSPELHHQPCRQVLIYSSQCPLCMVTMYSEIASLLQWNMICLLFLKLSGVSKRVTSHHRLLLWQGLLPPPLDSAACTVPSHIMMLVNKPWGKGVSIFISVVIYLYLYLYICIYTLFHKLWESSVHWIILFNRNTCEHTQWGERERETRRRLSTQELFDICFKQIQGGKRPWAPSNLLELQICSHLGFPSGIFLWLP